MSEQILAATAGGFIGRAFKPLRYEPHGRLGWLPIKRSSHLLQEKGIRRPAISACNDKHTDSKSLWMFRFVEEVLSTQHTINEINNAAIHFFTF